MKHHTSIRPQDQKYFETLRDRFCAPKPILAASVWAEKYLILNEPKIKGPFTIAGREYVREWVDAAGPLPDNMKGGTDFVLVGATGISKTIAMIARLTYRIANESMRALVVKPSGKGPAGAASFAKTRLQKSIRATPSLRELIPTGAFRHEFSSSQMQINGSIIDLTGAHSAGQLAENRCDVVEQDEIDKYPPQTDTSQEANPIYLADERTKSVPEARRYKQSSPSLPDTGIWEEFKKTDKRRYFVPCPHCNPKVYGKINNSNNNIANNSETEIEKAKRLELRDSKGWLVLAWSKRFTVFETKGYEAFIKWDDSARLANGKWDLEKVVKTAHMVCPHCQGKILNSHKHWMNQNGEWRATAQGIPGHIGWHLPSMYSTSRDCDFGLMAKKFLTAKASIDGPKGFINSDLAEPDCNQAVSIDRAGNAGKHIEVTGEWLKILSVDHQQIAPYFWYVVRAWNGSDKSHGIEYDSFNQWHEMDEVQERHKIIPQAVVIDARYNRSEVLQNCANLEMKSRGLLQPQVQDALPMWIGWTPAMAFGNHREFRITEGESVLYKPFRMMGNQDPYIGTELAKKVQIEILEFKSDLMEDRMENVRQGKTFFEWTISPEMDDETYHKHMAGKIRKAKKNNPRDYSWVQRNTDWDDHLRSCELLGFTLAYSLNLIAYDAIKSKEEKK